MTQSLLFKILKRDGIENIKKAILQLEREGYQPHDINDLTSRIVILYLSSISKRLPTEATKEAKSVLEDMIKDVLND